MDHNAAGNPHRQGTEEIPIWITMPEETTHAQPLPIVVYQHGFNRSKETGMADISRWLCDAGFAVVAMDLPVHGDRCEAPCIPGIGYLNFFDLPEFRDNSRQAIADHLSLLRALNQLNDLDQWPNGGDGTPDLDTENVFFLGHSLGGMVGASTMTLSPVYQAGATHSSGAGFREIIFNMNQLEIVFSILKSIQERTGQPIHDRIIGLIDLAMWVLEPGDPRSFAPLLNAPQADGEGPVEILVQINAWDWFMPPPASYAFLRHANLSLMEPIAESVDSLETVPAPYMGSVGFQIPMDSHDTMFQLPSVPEADAAQQQIVEFFNTKLTTGSATAVDPW
jgi:dienelactone hydrolase